MSRTNNVASIFMGLVGRFVAHHTKEDAERIRIRTTRKPERFPVRAFFI
jgi:hypothetical protein